jgi:hypothetical protein
LSCLYINCNDDYDEDDDNDEEYYDFFEDYCAPDDDAILTRITRGDDHTAERYGRAIDSGVLRTDGGVLRRGLGGCGNFGTFLYLFSLFFSASSKKWTTDRERCAKVRWQSSREARASHF